MLRHVQATCRYSDKALMAARDPEIMGCSAVQPQIVRDQTLGNERVFLEKLSQQFQRGMLVSLGLDQHVKDLAFGVDGAPYKHHAAVDLQINFIQMPD